MTTSRTGTAAWKRIRARELRRAQRLGQTQCPWCGVTLDYEVTRTPASAEPDHVEAWATTGSNAGPIRIICRRCNQSKGKRDTPKIATVMKSKPLKTSRKW